MTSTRPDLVNDELARRLTSIVFADSHGAFDKHLGAGYLYYGLAAMVRSQVSVCIGSGGGFVPRLLAQAQDDLGLRNAHTFLVDANLPDLGFGSPQQAGGWLGPDNDLQSATPRLSVLKMLSSDAARLFAQHDIRIDYLHIDGDHSKRGVVADLVDYLPLLSASAVVTLHDLRAVGVHLALSEVLAAYPSLEQLSFPEIGAGTAVVRCRAETTPPRMPYNLLDNDDPARRTTLPAAIIPEAVDRSQERARFERWHYLTTSAYRLRYELIARDIDLPGATVVELGGYPNSVVDFLRSAARVIAIEPYAPPEYLAAVEGSARDRGIDFRLLRGTVANVDLDPALLGDYVLVALGLDITQASENEPEFLAALLRLTALAANAKLLVLEVPGYKPSQITLEAIATVLAPVRLRDVSIDLSADPVGDEYFVKDGRARRRVLVLKPSRAPSKEVSARLLTDFAKQLADIKRAATAPEDFHYVLGSPIHFRMDTDVRRFLKGGWGPSERDKIWCLDLSSHLRLQIEGLEETPGDLQLRISLRPLVVPGKVDRQQFSVVANGHKLFEGAFDQPSTISVPLPRRLLMQSPRLDLTFVHPDGKRPKDIVPGNKDAKVLSVAIHSLQILPADANQ